MKKAEKLKPWRVKKSKYLIKDKWITVRIDECVASQGHVISPYYVLEYPDWVHMVVVNRKHEILILRQYRHGARRIFSEIVVGTVEPKDKNPLAAAKRELIEETGYSGKFILAGITSPNPATHTNRIYTYLVTNPTAKKIPKHNPFEIVEYKFTGIREVLRLIDKKKFAQELHIGSLFLALRKTNLVYF